MNAIFQYLVLVNDKRPAIDGMSREEIFKNSMNKSVESFKIYADVVGAEHIYTDQFWFDVPVSNELDEEDNFRLRRTHPFFEILRVIYDPIFDDYEKVLVADIDVIANTKENIFEVSSSPVYGVFESDITNCKGKFNYNSWDHRFNKDELLMMYKAHQDMGYPVDIIPPPNNPSRFMNMNTGVWVIDRDTRIFAREHFGDWRNWVIYCVKNKLPLWFQVDQFFICAEVMKHFIHYEGIDQKWNLAITNYGNDDMALEKGYFLHYSGGRGCMKMFDHYNQQKFYWQK